MPDLGLTHVALTARDLDASIAFYGKYAGMAVVHRRVREGVRSVWLSTTPGPSSSCWSDRKRKRPLFYRGQEFPVQMSRTDARLLPSLRV